MKITGGTGKQNQAGVNADFQLTTFATTELRSAHEARHNGRTYFWTTAYNYAAADTVIWLANTSTTLELNIEKIHIFSDATTQFTVHSPVYATPGGTLIPGVNSNRTIGSVASAEFYQDEVNNSQANVLIEEIILANTARIMPVDGKIVLGFHKCLAVDFVTVGTLGGGTFVGFYTDPTEN